MKIWFNDIKVIVVVFGDELDKDEFDILIFDQGDVIEVNSIDGVRKIVEEIMDKVFKGMI